MTNQPNDKKKKDQQRWDLIKSSPNWRGVACNTNETFALIELSIKFDMAVKKLRNGVFTQLSLEEATPLFDSLNDSLLILESTVETLSNATKLKYKTPPGIAAIKKNHTLSKSAADLIEALDNINNVKNDIAV